MTPLVHAIVAILLWGGIAALGMTSIMFASQHLGWSRMNWSLLIGALFTGDRHVASVLGFVLNLFGGYAFAFLYFLFFALLGAAGPWLGASLGAFHAAVLLLVFVPLLAWHPRIASEYDGPVASRRLEPPGFLALNYGWRTPLVTLMAHIFFGAVLGYGFAPLT